MVNLDIYCTTIHYFNVLDKLPSYIKPLGLGNTNYPNHWLTEKKGENISNLNKYYGETSGFYWIWKNKLNDKDKNDWIGSCHYRKLWLNDTYNSKQKFSYKSLYSELLNTDNEILVLEQKGVVQLVKDGNISKTPFLDIRDRVHRPLFPGDEMGLLGFAFDPNFNENNYC